ncbi:MAG: hypothetical protein HGA76_12325 [Candidatus Firestonebacteria bacterium]|nr:hypothetical protein [Candidatus Firestonebacteria bacterium]
MMASSAVVPSAPTSAPVTPQALLQDAAFTPGAQFVPAYTLPQTGAVNLENSEDASLLARLTSALPAQQRSETSVARSSLELQALLAKSQQTKPLFTELDWEKQMLAAVFLNPTEAAGYRLQLNDIVQMSDKILIQYSVLRPVTVLPAFEAAPPALFVVLPFSPLPVEFQEK